MTRQTALVIAPGRGTYNKAELGYLGRHHGDRRDLIDHFDALRRELAQPTISELDGAERYSMSTFSRGDNASALIHACAYADFLSIDRDAFDIVAVTGNSMGWYIALACAGALNAEGGFQVINTMGTLMHEFLIGGQVIYPFVDENWQEIPGRKAELLALIDRIPDLYLSIDLGGMLVFAGEAAALEALEAELPPLDGRFPMRLANHAGFHSPLQAPVAKRGREALPAHLFHQPETPLIDGRGHVWLPRASNLHDLWDYTLGEQVTEPYDFRKSVTHAVREFAPDRIIVLGPGSTLTGAVAQSLISINWEGHGCKQDFIARQKEDPLILAMNEPAQRALATNR